MGASLIDLAQELADVGDSLFDVADSLIDVAKELDDVGDSLFDVAPEIIDVAPELDAADDSLHQRQHSSVRVPSGQDAGGGGVTLL